MFGGYVLNDASTRRFADIASRGDAERIWEWLDEEVGRVTPDYTYPPFLLSLAVDFLRQRGWKSDAVPRDVQGAAERGEIDVLLFQQNDAPQFDGAVTDAQLDSFFGSIVGEEWESAPAALREAFDFIRRGVSLAKRDGASFVLLIGS